MARPFKQGLDYFPLDVEFDDQIELIDAEHGAEGFKILIKIWQKIYKNGYYIDWNNDVCTLFSKRINVDINKVNVVINSLLLRNLLDSNLYEKYGILTSIGIQKRYFKACADSRRKNITAISEYLLLMGELTGLITELTPLNSNISTQKKERGEEREREKEIETKKRDYLVNDSPIPSMLTNAIKRWNFYPWLPTCKRLPHQFNANKIGEINKTMQTYNEDEILLMIDTYADIANPENDQWIINKRYQDITGFLINGADKFLIPEVAKVTFKNPEFVEPYDIESKYAPGELDEIFGQN